MHKPLLPTLRNRGSTPWEDPYYFFSVGASREACLLGALKRLVCFGFLAHKKMFCHSPLCHILGFSAALLCFDLAAMHQSFWVGRGRVCTAKKTDQANESRRERRDLRRHWMHPASWMQPLIRQMRLSGGEEERRRGKTSGGWSKSCLVGF